MWVWLTHVRLWDKKHEDKHKRHTNDHVHISAVNMVWVFGIGHIFIYFYRIYIFC